MKSATAAVESATAAVESATAAMTAFAATAAIVEGIRWGWHAVLGV